VEESSQIHICRSLRAVVEREFVTKYGTMDIISIAVESVNRVHLVLSAQSASMQEIIPDMITFSRGQFMVVVVIVGTLLRGKRKAFVVCTLGVIMKIPLNGLCLPNSVTVHTQFSELF